MATNSTLPPILIYGAGAIGCQLGGALAGAGAPVTLFGRDQLATAIAADGLRLITPQGERTVQVPVITSLDQLSEAPGLVLLTVKAYAVADALADLRRLAEAGAAIVTMQNGVGTEETLLGEEVFTNLAAGVVTISVSQEGPGIVRQETTGNGVTLAPVRGNVPIEKLAAALSNADIPTGIVSDYRAMKWSKLLLNIMGNATSAILALSPAAIYRDRQLFAVERAAFIEALVVMLADDILPIALPGFNVPLVTQVMRLPQPIARWLVARRVASGRGEKRPSLWLDVERDRGLTEVGWLNGAVVEAGARLGIPTPVNARLTELVQAIAADPSQRAAFAGQPAALLRALEHP